MRPFRRRLVLRVATAFLLAVPILGAVIGVAEASRTDASGPSGAAPTSTSATSVRSTTTDGRGQSATHTVSVAVLPGSLTVDPSDASVELRRDGSGAYAGPLEHVRVVDARGSLVGWHVTASVAGASADLAGAQLSFSPDRPVAIYGNDVAIAEGDSHGTVGSSMPFFSAPAGDGGGTFEDGARITVELPHAIDADAIVVKLSFSVA